MPTLLHNDDASSGVLIYFSITVLGGLLIYLFIGPFFDALFDLGGSLTTGTSLPVSEERITTLGILRLAISAIPFVAIFLPAAYHAIITSLRQEGGSV